MWHNFLLCHFPDVEFLFPRSFPRIQYLVLVDYFGGRAEVLEARHRILSKKRR